MADSLEQELGAASAQRGAQPRAQGGVAISGNPVLDGRDPLTREPLGLSPDARVVSTTSHAGPVGHYVSEEWRVAYDWRRLGLTEEFIGAVAHEAEIWDRWAHRQELSYAPEKDLSVEALFSKTAALKKARERVADLCEVSDKRVLDVGGSCKDSLYFLYSGAARVDQVEVAAQSQRLALDRLRAALSARGRTWEGRVFFHTIPAERLPFEDSVFDFAFSRSTIHHLRRREAFREIHRVLKPGGRLFFLERYLGSLGQHAIMKGINA